MAQMVEEKMRCIVKNEEIIVIGRMKTKKFQLVKLMNGGFKNYERNKVRSVGSSTFNVIYLFYF